MKRFGLLFGLMAALAFAACSTSGTTSTTTTVAVNLVDTSSPFYAASGITFTGDPSTDFGSGYLLFVGQGPTSGTGYTNGEYIYNVYVAFDSKHLYIGHSDPNFVNGDGRDGDPATYCTGDDVKDLYVFFNTGIDSDGITILSAAGLSAAGMSGSFDSYDDLQGSTGTGAAVGKYTGFIKHYRNAPWSGRRAAATLDEGMGQSIKLYAFVDGACTVYRFGQDEDAQGHDTSATAGWNNCVSNGVTEWAIPLSALYGTASEYPKYLKIGMAVAGDSDGMPATTTQEAISEWTNIAIGLAGAAVDPTTAIVSFDAASYAIYTGDKTVTVSVADAGLADTATPTVTITGGTPASYDVVLASDGAGNFTNSFTVGTVGDATADIQFSANATLTASYDDTAPVETDTATAAIIFDPNFNIDGFEDPMYASVTPYSDGAADSLAGPDISDMYITNTATDLYVSITLVDPSAKGWNNAIYLLIDSVASSGATLFTSNPPFAWADKHFTTSMGVDFIFCGYGDESGFAAFTFVDDATAGVDVASSVSGAFDTSAADNFYVEIKIPLSTLGGITSGATINVIALENDWDGSANNHVADVLPNNTGGLTAGADDALDQSVSYTLN